ncbi:hypothetical protein J6590_029940 [Homalodisca vitripennis]|nr:hypothetical protein J6590_029940 [Homalodisca vitripennis]
MRPLPLVACGAHTKCPSPVNMVTSADSCATKTSRRDEHRSRPRIKICFPRFNCPLSNVLINAPRVPLPNRSVGSQLKAAGEDMAALIENKIGITTPSVAACYMFSLRSRPSEFLSADTAYYCTVPESLPWCLSSSLRTVPRSGSPASLAIQRSLFTAPLASVHNRETGFWSCKKPPLLLKRVFQLE